MLIMAEDKKSNTGGKFVAKVTKRLGSKKNGSPRYSVTRGEDLGTLSKDDQDLFRKHNIID